MNEKPGETPNPLNANPVGAPEPAPAAPVAPEPAPVVPEPAPAEPAPVAPADPMARPMEQAPEVTAAPAPKKKKTGLIVGIIIAALVIIGGIIAAILLLNTDRSDAVSKAMSKIMSGGAPENVKIDGTLNITPSDTSSGITNLKITVNSDASTSSLINSSVAQLTATVENVGDVSVSLSEVYAENGGDLYLKVDGLAAALETYTKAASNKNTAVLEETDEVAVSGETTTADIDVTEMLAGFSGVVEMIDGEWLRISSDDLSSLTGDTTEDSQTTCLMNVFSGLKNYNNSIAEIYGNNQFVSSTTEGVTLASKNGGPVYKVVIDQEKFSGFVTAMQDSELVKNLQSCAGSENSTVNTNELTQELSKLPTLYVEVDSDYNFTRVYFDATSEEGDVAVTTDLGLAYPDNINVAEPANYKDLSTVIQQLFTTMYSTDTE